MNPLFRISNAYLFTIPRADVEARNHLPLSRILQSLLSTPEGARNCAEKVGIFIDGYNDDPRALYRIPEVRSYVAALDEIVPYWFYVLGRDFGSLVLVMKCLLPIEEVGSAHSRAEAGLELQKLVERLFVRMNAVCAFAGYSEGEVARMSDRIVRHLREWRMPLL